VIVVSILSAHRVAGDSAVLARADVLLDGLVQVRGVEVVEAGSSGRPIAVPPRRPYGGQGRVLGWSSDVAADLARSIMGALDGELRAVAGDEAEATLARQLLMAPAPPGRELPPDPRKRPRRLDPDELLAAIAEEPGIGRAALAEALDMGLDAIGAAASRLQQEGRIRAELNGQWRYWPAEAQP
jgi:hypothetical protein